MQGLEALYVAEFGDVVATGRRNGGVVVVLETGRIFGGDSGYYYVGQIKVTGTALSAEVEVVKHDPSWRDVFGDTAQRFRINISATISGGTITGTMERLDKPGHKLPIRLTRAAALS